MKHSTFISAVKSEQLEGCTREVLAADKTVALQELVFGWIMHRWLNIVSTLVGVTL
jgi:hypothetical protein